MSLYRVVGMLCAGLVVSSGCAQEYALTTVDGEEDGASSSQSVSAAGRASVDETFEINSEVAAPQADYLFVVDSSVSMLGVLKDVRAGLRTVGKDGLPAGTRIAVMTTTPAAITGSGEPFPGVVDQDAARVDPGFQKLIDGQGLVTWKNARAAEKFTSEGCDGGWFSPSDVNEHGEPCVLAITTIPLYKANAEAGLVAVKQFLQSRGDEPLFRDGAAANIVFISDTHDPGMPAGPARDVLVELRPDWNELQTLVSEANVVSSLRVHAIAPKTECVEGEAWADIGPSYFEVAKASGGQIFDVCTTSDYSEVLRNVTRFGALPQHGVLTLENPAVEVVGVEVDGEPVAFSVKRKGAVVRLDGKLPNGAASVKVTYR